MNTLICSTLRWHAYLTFTRCWELAAVAAAVNTRLHGVRHRLCCTVSRRSSMTTWNALILLASSVSSLSSKSDVSETASRLPFSSQAPGRSPPDHTPDRSCRPFSRWLSTRSKSCWHRYCTRHLRFPLDVLSLSSEGLCGRLCTGYHHTRQLVIAAAFDTVCHSTLT